MLELIRPVAHLENKFLDMVKEYRNKSEFFIYHDVAALDFQAYLQECAEYEQGIHLKPGYVTQTTFWLVQDKDEIIGESRLRHYLTPILELEGGHIGYAIRPAQRLKGYGVQILKLTLQEAAKLGLQKALLTCNADNMGSQKIILANGGIFDGENISPHSQKWVNRYWVPVH
jgi:predicted acetyltransferase